ncbi:alpha/beta fold hydrolase [Nocardia huaxiensis]|uniref:Alpha/beta hydrolase n=1 Tax=Nocardia huaxiensis TaxID=2755382 RepID=A0A7D6VE19_9NOCA|nr:alpha/beta hydrolase [Nocardia huaxiensis]QLY33194.1 alpha/beta hydrolase [Nocardia huaxiensis]UFS99879.1 alpha/beta hydrolase [Nocardia huaxiensis]
MQNAVDSVVSEPPAIAGVRRSFVEARGVRFHVTESGPADGRPVLVLHGWPQHHYAYRDLLANPPEGLRIIAPDLPGYGWSGPAPHRWEKEEVAADLLALLDALGIGKTLLVGHDWGGYVGYRLVLREPQRFDGFLVLNMAHPWAPPGVVARQLWRFALYQPAVAAFGMPLQQRTRVLHWLIRTAFTDRTAATPELTSIFADRFRDPVCARAATDTYRSFLLREMPRLSRNPERRRATVPIRALFGVDDGAVHYSLADPRTARADDYRLVPVSGCGHFIADERPDLVRAQLVALAAETATR